MAFDFRAKTTAKVKQIMFAFDLPFCKTVRLTAQFYRSPNTWTKGISSRCSDGAHILFLDYDKQELKQVRDEVKYLQESFNLSNAYIFKTDKDSFHVIFLCKRSVLDQFNIMQETNSEWAYLQSIKLARGREWVLRCVEKGKRPRPEFVEVLFSKHPCPREISTAHRRFLEIWYNVPTIKYKFEDNITELPIIDYTTGNRVD